MNLKNILVLVSSLCLAAQAMAQSRSTTGIPGWFRQEMEILTHDGGRWVADTAAFRSEQESFDAYGLEWRWGPGRASITGRLFGLRDGEEIGDYWQFRM